MSDNRVEVIHLWLAEQLDGFKHELKQKFQSDPGLMALVDGGEVEFHFEWGISLDKSPVDAKQAQNIIDQSIKENTKK